MAQRSAILRQVHAASSLVDVHGVEQAKDQAMEISACIENTLKIVDERSAASLHRVIH